MRILVVDDDLDSCNILSMTLGREGYEVTCTHSYEEGLQALYRMKPALLILDVLLPRMSGWDLCQQIRTFSDVPILMISAFARTADDKAHGMDVGGDAYITKPINHNLLKSTIRALLRRSALTEGGFEDVAYIDARLVIDIHDRQVRVQGQLISLSPFAFLLLETLVRNINETVPTIELVETLWPSMVDEGQYIGYVRTYIKRLRNVIEPAPQEPIYIMCDYGLGYRFVSHASCT